MDKKTIEAMPVVNVKYEQTTEDGDKVVKSIPVATYAAYNKAMDDLASRGMRGERMTRMQWDILERKRNKFLKHKEARP